VDDARMQGGEKTLITYRVWRGFARAGGKKKECTGARKKKNEKRTLGALSGGFSKGETEGKKGKESVHGLGVLA